MPLVVAPEETQTRSVEWSLKLANQSNWYIKLQCRRFVHDSTPRAVFQLFLFFTWLVFFLAFFFVRFEDFSVHAMRQIYRQALSSLLGWCHRCCPNAKRDKHTHTHTLSHTYRVCLLGPTHAIQHPLRSGAELFCATMDRMRGLKLCWKCHRKIQHDNKGWHKFPPTSCCRCHMSDAMWQADPATAPAPATAPHSIHIHVPKMAIVDVVVSVVVAVAVAVIANWSMCAGQVKVAPAPCASRCSSSSSFSSSSVCISSYIHIIALSVEISPIARQGTNSPSWQRRRRSPKTQRISRNMHNEGSSKRDEQVEQWINKQYIE